MNVGSLSFPLMPELPSLPTDRPLLTTVLREAGATLLPGLLGIELVEIAEEGAALRLEIQQKHFAPNGYLHGGTLAALADTAAGYGCVGSLPEGGIGFTTLEMKSNFLGTARDGTLVAVAEMIHGGRTTQVWDVDITHEATPKVLSKFRGTQMILYPRD